ncbi:MAG: molybdenum cofactor guanylyltransferase [Thiohalocapsa sp.]|jgi:molybdopterin-guanine dinucleotide biosynthesis protein A|uniref:molybdenum cofactor guanylyltransferase MobA n=1 Tax=Thiohalocapsa sp. TaxID=2497641 RepID=UPI0025FF73AF|nr:molybdenum cofactor guanylyltransferase MobA [Thiohalocapsa sp.]MCG6943667.1 molybdenum cofactor guanylyltransferase [Thiohalocapsa sp.]
MERNDITGLILAGGAGRRMRGRDKGLVELHGRPLAAWTADRLRPQVGRLWISANRNAEHYAALAERVIPDRLDGYQGPLAGIAATLAVIETPWLLTCPCDTPLLPADLCTCLAAALAADPDADLAIAADTERQHPLHALLPARLAPGLDAYLADGGRSVRGWLAGLRPVVVTFDAAHHAFDNINSPADIASLTAASGSAAP